MTEFVLGGMLRICDECRQPMVMLNNVCQNPLEVHSKSSVTIFTPHANDCSKVNS